MAFFSLLLYVACIYVRPQEWVPLLYGAPLINITAIMTVVFFLFSRDRKYVHAPQNYLMLSFLAALTISHLVHAYFGGALNAFNDFSKTLILYFLIIHIVSTSKRFAIFIDVLMMLTLFLGIQGIIQYSTGIGMAGQPILLDGAERRITWIGIFSDPNDLALSFVIMIPFLINAILTRGGVFRKTYSLLASGILVYALWLTNSRGGILALSAVLCTYFYLYMKRNGRAMVGIVISLIMIAGVIMIAPSRMSDISASGDSAYGRIDAWYDGIQMFKSSPLFGVGYQMFTDYHFRTAHNSFILALAEIGLFGYLLWIALFYFSMKSPVMVAGSPAGQNTLSSHVVSLKVALVGFLAAAFFLSRTYNPLPYMLIALSAAQVNIGIKQGIFKTSKINTVDMRNVLFLCIGSMAITLILIKIAI